MTRTALGLAVLLVALPAFAQNDERAAVRQAALDYVTAVYESRPELIERSVSPELTKHGFMRQPDGRYRRAPMTYQELLAVAKEWNADRKRDTSIKEAVVGEVLDQTATATVRAQWGVDLMQLAKIDGRWKILNIVWQSHPPTTRQ
jgi:hypothetical protein